MNKVVAVVVVVLILGAAALVVVRKQASECLRLWRRRRGRAHSRRGAEYRGDFEGDDARVLECGDQRIE